MIIVIDVGTTNCKSLLFNEKGHISSIAYKEYDNIYLSATTIEQNPKVWFNSVLETMSECIKKFSGTYEIEAIIVTSQRATIIPINKKGDFLRNAILWLDKRSISECEFIRLKIGEWAIYKKTGLRIDPYFSAPKILWIKNNQPDIYNNTYKFLTVHDYIIYNLTGEMITDQTQASRTMLFNIDKFCWDNEIFECLGIDQDKFPQVIATGTKVGELKYDIAKKIDLPKGIPVFAGGGDQQLAAIGLGAIKEDRIGITTGGGSFIVMHSDESLRDERMRILCSVSAIPNKWILEAGVLTTGSIYKWFKDTFGQIEVILSKELKKSPYEILDMEVEIDSRKPSGLILLPHFAGSAAPYWNPFAKGILFNLTLNTNRKDLIKALLECICLEIKKNILIMEELSKKIIKEIYVGGGMCKSDLFNQIQADVYGKPVIKVLTQEVVSLGAAMICWTKLGLYKDLNECISNIIKIEKKVVPNYELTKKYDAILKISEEIYNALEEKGLYKKTFEIFNS
ncbi:MAG: FGGY-family carbohydrate kinase [Candidatus Methanomethylicaceae archaeon]